MSEITGSNIDLSYIIANFKTKMDLTRGQDDLMLREQLGLSINWSYNFLRDFFLMAARDYINYATYPIIDGSDILTPWLEENIGMTDRFDPSQIEEIINWLRMEAGEIECYISEIIDQNEYGVWTVELNNAYMKVIYNGDFRVMEWERDHVDPDTGAYSQTPLPTVREVDL